GQGHTEEIAVTRRLSNQFSSWGFGFITFADPASVDKVLAQGTHELDGKKFICLKGYIANGSWQMMVKE
ncbi:hypothetical protein L9F63_002138, partial [Diploptera punctata]